MALGKFLKKASKVALPAGAAYFGWPLLGGAGITNPALQGALLGGFTSLASGQKPRDALIGAGLGALLPFVLPKSFTESPNQPMGYQGSIPQYKATRTRKDLTDTMNVTDPETGVVSTVP